MVAVVEQNCERRWAVISNDLAQVFDNYFDIRIARTKKDLEAAYRLRYQVYCVENNFENPEDFPDGLERDEFDDRSVHALLVYTPTDDVIGSVRLVLPDPKGGGLPCQTLDPNPLQHLLRPFDPKTSGEISRYAIARTFRRRVGERRYPDMGWHYDSEAIAQRIRRAMPYLSLALFRGIIALSEEYGVKTVFAVVEPALHRLFHRFQVDLTPLGPLVEHHGRRQPCYAEMDDLYQAMCIHRPELWDVVKSSSTKLIV